MSLLTVCMKHYRVVPCRMCAEPHPEYWSTEQEDVEYVINFQKNVYIRNEKEDQK